MIPQTNAVATLVKSVATSEDWDHAETDTTKWQGHADAYYMENTERVQNGGSTDIIVRRSLIVDAEMPTEDFTEGDIVTFRYKGTVRTAKVKAAQERQLTPLPGVTRLTFDDS